MLAFLDLLYFLLKVVVNAPKGIFEKKKVSAEKLHAYCLDSGLGIGAEERFEFENE